MSRSAEMTLRQASPADKWISRTAGGTVTALAGLAGAQQLQPYAPARPGPRPGWHADALPLSADGIEIVASLVLLADRRARHRSGWLPWTALADGTADSLAANIATTHPDAVSRIIAGWPAAALLIAVKLLTGILERPDVPDVVSVAADQANQATDSASTGSSVPGTMLTSPLGPAGNAHPAQVRSCPAESGHQQPSSSPAMADPALDSHAAALLPAARAARNELCQDGLPLTCDALAARLRQHGHPIRNASVTPLLRHLRHEQPTHLARLTHGQIANQRPASQSTGGTTGHRKADPPTRPTRAGRPRHAARAHSQHPTNPDRRRPLLRSGERHRHPSVPPRENIGQARVSGSGGSAASRFYATQ